ncbi:UV-B-induced protein At3g17800, chloroplastic [Sesamum indicum]|uniref:UV-B-induced protein At3g17800, chloroplastic n=1 Tax=Sesamum indicum TaxID=4182 RepID=A0A6I9SRU9_SESIN|nr:UV-B-induced protein At3g17800, chloroplastic [Sesamum indicum]XP_020548048.1 UV-B-induced protein At3g17800, chloroplastic [Sesamum indicum]
METVAAFRASFSSVSPNWVARSGPARPELRVGSRSLLSYSWIRQRPSISHVKLGNRKVDFVTRKCTGIRASMQPSDSGSAAAPIAPLQLESPIGQFLSQILVSHPHLVPAAVEQQLEQLQTDRDAEKEKEEPAASGTELVLYRRIAEVKANERRKALEEILYALVVQKFMDANVSLIPTITPSSPDNSGRVDSWPSQDDKLESLHSPEAYEMIQNHLALILGNRLGDSNSVAQISKLRVGQVYAASVMYGYFLRRVDQRFQLEKSMKVLPQSIDNEENHIEQVIADDMRPSGDYSNESLRNPQPHPEVSSWSGGLGAGGFGRIKPSRLRTYVMSFDGETLQRYATIRSKEAISIIEKHTEALFGRPEIVITPEGTVDSSKDELIKISFGGLRRLVLEAVTFGSFLWDVESYVDSRYHFVAN